MPYDTVNNENIGQMVREFYAIVLKDDLLAPYFSKALGDDLDNGKWHGHLNTLNQFWVLMMTGKKGYGGDPFPPHAFLGQMYRETFERWLELFKETVNRLFAKEIAEKFYYKADVLAEQFIDNLGIDDEDDDD
ncbi:group III truncated hemoglobin [Sulfurimonas sp.]|jgi:hemoglobin|uniref:group III truncated hemoglobin n=1 Tax=Sulfurimonas sp. TaxID=2022749 RepID=UPI0025F7F8F6|nr:group III truncated hemoglobin [Sulfurimonas sp.]MBT5935077.1 group III truncated hemoglobin [Sulfurimonas sp.]